MRYVSGIGISTDVVLTSHNHGDLHTENKLTNI